MSKPLPAVEHPALKTTFPFPVPFTPEQEKALVMAGYLRAASECEDADEDRAEEVCVSRMTINPNTSAVTCTRGYTWGCHNVVASQWPKGGFGAMYSQTQLSPDDEPTADEKLFAQYFVEESPWRHNILTKSYQDFLEKGLIVHHRLPTNLFGATLIASRTLWYSCVTQTFEWLVNTVGVKNKDTAFMLSHFLSYYPGQKIFRLTYNPGAHGLFTNTMRPQAWLNYIQHNPQYYCEDHVYENYSLTATYNGIFRLWEGNACPQINCGRQSIDPHVFKWFLLLFHNLVETDAKVSEVPKVSLNPFTKALETLEKERGRNPDISYTKRGYSPIELPNTKEYHTCIRTFAEELEKQDDPTKWVLDQLNIGLSKKKGLHKFTADKFDDKLFDYKFQIS